MSTTAKSELTPLLDMILPSFDPTDASGDTLPVEDQTAIDPSLAPDHAITYTALTAAARARHNGRAA